MQLRSMWVRAWLVMLGAAAITACGDDALSDVDGGATRDAATIDAATSDAGSEDDAATLDAAATDDASGDDAAVAPDADAPDAAMPVTGADTCELAQDVTAGGTFTGQSTRAPATDDYGPMGAGCPSGGAASGRDVAYLVRPTVASSYRVRVEPSASTPTYDPLLYAVSTCGAAGCIAGTTLNGPGQAEEITFAVAADETVYVVVDGELASSGDFDLTVTLE